MVMPITEGEKIMNVREYLKEIKELDALIYCKKLRIQGLWSSITYPGISYDFKVQSSKKFDKHCETICKITEIEEEIKQMEKELNRRKQEVEQAIKKLDHEEMAQVIRKRYIELKSWEEITNEIGHSKRWIMELHRKAMKKLCMIFELHFEKVV